MKWAWYQKTAPCSKTSENEAGECSTSYRETKTLLWLFSCRDCQNRETGEKSEFMGTGLPCKHCKQNSGGFLKLATSFLVAVCYRSLSLTQFVKKELCSWPNFPPSVHLLLLVAVSRTWLWNTFVLWPRAAELSPCRGQREGKHGTNVAGGTRFQESLQTPARRRELTNRTLWGATAANLSVLIGSGEVEEENLMLTSTMPPYRSWIQNGFFEWNCSNADTWLIVQTLGKSHSGANIKIWVLMVFLGMGKLMRYGFFFSTVYNEFHLLDILEFSLFICK